MSKKATGVVAYITWIGWLIAFFAGDREGAKFHLNQALVLWIFEIVINVLSVVFSSVTIVTLILGILGIVCFVFWILGLVHAVKEEEKPLPLIGGITILK